MTKKPSSKRKKSASATSSDSTPPDDQDLEDISLQENPGSATITVSAVEVEELSEEEQRERLHLERRVERAVELAGGKVPTGRIVKDVVQRIMERTKVPNTYQIGEVCQILAKDNPELRGKGGCWAIVSAVNEFSCIMRMWDGEYAVGLQHLKSFNYFPQECEQMQVICDRLARIYSDSLEETVKNLLQSLGRLNRSYLTAVEEKLLSVLETEYEER